MAAQQVTIIPGYENIWGTKKSLCIELTGPSSYSTGGQVLNASQFGWGGFDAVIGVGRSYSGTFKVADVQYMPVDAAPSAVKGAVAQVKLPWYNVSDGLEVTATTDLDEQIVRVLLIGV